MAKPKVTVNPVANQYTSANERIIEYSHKGLGGLIAFRESDDGLVVDLYRHDEGVKIRVAPVRAEYETEEADGADVERWQTTTPPEVYATED